MCVCGVCGGSMCVQMKVCVCVWVRVRVRVCAFARLRVCVCVSHARDGKDPNGSPTCF